jgi:rRNA-processing protein FCF1
LCSSSSSEGGGGTIPHTFYVVVDTNVLIESLERFDLLCTCNTCNSWHLVVCVPWTVLCELDGLKASSKRNYQRNYQRRAFGIDGDGEALGERARLAMRYLEHAFSSSSSSQNYPHPHPQQQQQTSRVRFLGQSMQEFRKATEDFGVKGLKQYSNDDLILQCTLQKQKMAVEKRQRQRQQNNPNKAGVITSTSSNMEHVVLLTNDRNLCLKSSACGVPAFPLERLMANFDNILASVAAENDSKEREREEGQKQQQQQHHQGSIDNSVGSRALAPQARLVKEVKTLIDSDGLSAQVLGLLRTSLSFFIEASFVDNFGEKEWRSMVVVPPPWTTMADLFKLMKQHWFSLDLDQKVQSIMELVQHVHERLHDTNQNINKKKKKMQREDHLSSSISNSTPSPSLEPKKEEGEAPTTTKAVIPKQTFLMLFEKTERLLSLIWAKCQELKSIPPSSKHLLDQQAEWRHLHHQVYTQR